MWQEIMKDKQKLNRINQTTFSLIDTNDNKRIQIGQLEDILAMTAQEMNIQRPSKDEIKQIMKWLDPSNKGFLNKQNFATLVTQVLKLLKQNEEM